MKKDFQLIKFIASGFLVLLFVVILLTVNNQLNVHQILGTNTSASPISSSSPEPTGNLSATPKGSSLCTSINGLPDSGCTPGVIDPKVTQDNLYQTICTSGYTKTVRPPVSYTNQLKVQQIQQYGYEDTNPSDYEEDHLISLEIGGNPTDPKNLWPEPGSSPNAKDSIENKCHTKVCSGQITLAEAQKEISTYWPTACEK